MRSIICLRNVQHAGTALAVKLRVLISDSRSCLEQSVRLAHCSNVARMSWGLLGGNRASSAAEIKQYSEVFQASRLPGGSPGHYIG